MLFEFKNSFDNVLKDKTTSPLFGAVAFSWLAWNWKIIYITFFISESNITDTKINYILENYTDWGHSLIYPLLLAAFILFGYPYISNYVLKITLLRKKESDVINESYSKTVRLTVSQSNKIKEKIADLELKMAQQLNEKDEEKELLIQEKTTLKTKNDELIKENDTLKTNMKTVQGIVNEMEHRIKNERTYDPSTNAILFGINELRNMVETNQAVNNMQRQRTDLNEIRRPLMSDDDRASRSIKPNSNM